MRNLVTGGAGFIGSHLIDQILKDGDQQVICIDNFQTGTKENITQWLDNPRFEVIRHDVCEPIRLDVERIWHLACPASPQNYQKNPIATSKTNVLGTLNILGIAKRCKARVLMASTSEVYGDPLEHPQTENYYGNVSCTGIRSCYDEGKRMAESLCFDYSRSHGVEVRVARIFNTYGPRLSHNDGRVVTNLITQALTGKPLTIYGDGLQTRSFCYVKDLVEGLVLLMQSTTTGPVNLGNPEEKTIIQLAGEIQGLISRKTSIEHHSLPVDDPHRRKPSIERAKRELGWEPKTKLREGLIKTISYIENKVQTQSLSF